MRARWVAIVMMSVCGVAASGALAAQQPSARAFTEPVVAVLMMDEGSPGLRIAMAADMTTCSELCGMETAPSPGGALVVTAMTIAAIVRGRRSL